MEDKWLSQLIINWYRSEKRDLPWRHTTDPYAIWISEIILQQTRVDQGLSYYQRFMTRFPDVRALAEADEQEVLKMWQGLGYYSRARNLHAAAKMVLSDFGGVFPTDYVDIRRLKGVGDYTAAAISSFAFGLPHAVVDGNVYRLFARLFNVDLPIDSGEGKRFFAELAQKYLSVDDPATHNQAVMEFGALHCVPKNPDCQNCIFQVRCLANAAKKVDRLPVKSQKTTIKNRYFNYFRVRFGDIIYLNKRSEDDVWQNLYEFPLIETSAPVSLEELMVTPEFKAMFPRLSNVTFRLVAENVVHILSHRKIMVNYYEAEISEEFDHFDAFTKVTEAEFDLYPVSSLILLLISSKYNL